jgi:nicotinate-nucleotide adenylyltransferase
MAGRGSQAVNGARWGILGGTFDPPHYGHLLIAEQVRDALALAGVHFVPAAQPPHKIDRPISPAGHRRAMVERAIADNPAFDLLAVELERGGLSYSVDTLEQLTTDRPADRFVFIVSVDAARQLPDWHEPRRLLELCEVAVVPRLGYPPLDASWASAAFGGLAQHILFVDSPALGHSASDIRRRVAAGRTIRYLVPASVEDYISQHRLYVSDD